MTNLNHVGKGTVYEITVDFYKTSKLVFEMQSECADLTIHWQKYAFFMHAYCFLTI